MFINKPLTIVVNFTKGLITWFSVPTTIIAFAFYFDSTQCISFLTFDIHMLAEFRFRFFVFTPYITHIIHCKFWEFFMQLFTKFNNLIRRYVCLVCIPYFKYDFSFSFIRYRKGHFFCSNHISTISVIRICGKFYVPFQ